MPQKNTCLYIAITILLLSTLACGIQTAKPAMMVHVPDADFEIYPIQTTGAVNIREVEQGKVVGSLPSGYYFLGICDNDWCFISGTVYKVFRGCTTYNPDKLGCR